MPKIIFRFFTYYKHKSIRILFGFIGLLAMLLALYQLKNIQLVFDFESFFAQDSEERVFYDEHKTQFGYDNDYLLLITRFKGNLFTKETFADLQHWQNKAQQIDGVAAINSPLKLKRIIQSPLGLNAYPVLHIKDQKKLLNDSLVIVRHPIYKQYFNFEKNAILVFIKHEHFENKIAEDNFLNSIRKSLDASELNETHLVGRLTAQQSFIENIRFDFILFSSLALVLSFILLWLIYRSLRLVILPYAVSVTTMIITLGIAAYFGIALSILSVLLPTIILFVSTSDAIHLLNAYRSSGRGSFSEKLIMAIKKVLAPTFLTSLTTAIGFLSLMVLPSQPIRELGMVAALGVLIAFVINFIFGPLLLVSDKKATLINLPVRSLALFIFKKQKYIYACFTILIIAAGHFSFQLNSDSYLLKDLPENDSVREDFEMVDNHFGGSKPWELAIWTADSSSIWQEDILIELNKVNNFLTDSLGFGRVISPVQAVKFANQAVEGGLIKNYVLPEDNFNEKLQVAKKLNKFTKNEVVNQDGNYARFLAFMPDWGALTTKTKNERLFQFISTELDNDIVQYKLTGTSYLIDKSNELVSFNLLKGLLIAIGLIAIILAFYFKSVKLLVISLIPNFVPLLFVAGLMGFMEVPIKLTTTVIFVVAFSIAVDDTIHFIASFKNHSSRSPIWRIIKTFRLAGFSILITTVIIVCGFSLFILSNFATTFYLGLFLTVSLLMALITDIFLLPLILKGQG